MSQRDKEGALPKDQYEQDPAEPDNGTVLDFLWQGESISGPHEAGRQEQADTDGDLGEALVRYSSWLTGWHED